jgi:hypothetical protein
MTSVKFEKLDVSKLVFEEVTLPNKKTILLPRIDGKEIPNIILPRIELTHYGIPKLGQFYKTDQDRMFIKLPIEGELLERFALVDHYLEKNGLGEYSPLVKYGSLGPYVKIKLETDYQTGQIETIFWESEKHSDGVITRHPEPLGFENLDDLASMVCRGASIVGVIRFVKLWCVNKKYGLTIKLVKANVLCPEKKVVVDCSGLDFDF